MCVWHSYTLFHALLPFDFTQVFYTKQEIWSSEHSLFRAFNSLSTTLSPPLFVQLVEELKLQSYYLKVASTVFIHSNLFIDFIV